MEFKTKIAILASLYFIGFCVVLSVLLYKNTKTNKNDKIKHVLADLVQKMDEISNFKTTDSVILKEKENKDDGAETSKTLNDISSTDDDRQDENSSDDSTNQELQRQDHQNQFNNQRQFTINQRKQENNNQNNQQPNTGNSTVLKCEICDSNITKPGKIFCDQCAISIEQKKLQIRSGQGKKGQGGMVNPFLKNPDVLRINNSKDKIQDFVNTTALSSNHSKGYLVDENKGSIVSSAGQGSGSSDIVKEEKILEQDVKNKTVAKYKCEFIILAKKPGFKKDFIIDSNNNKTLGIFSATKLKDEEKESDDLFILNEINVVPNDKEFKLQNTNFKIPNQKSNFEISEKLKEFILDPDDYNINEAEMEFLKKPISDFIIYLKSNFFKEINNLVKNGAKVEKKQFIMENVLIAKGNSSAFILFKIENNLYDTKQLVKKYFEEKTKKNGIESNITLDILISLVIRLNSIFIPIANQFNINFKFSSKSGDELNDLIRKFLWLFYDEDLSNSVEFNCKIEIEQS